MPYIKEIRTPFYMLITDCQQSWRNYGLPTVSERLCRRTPSSNLFKCFLNPLFISQISVWLHFLHFPNAFKSNRFNLGLNVFQFFCALILKKYEDKKIPKPSTFAFNGTGKFNLRSIKTSKQIGHNSGSERNKIKKSMHRRQILRVEGVKQNSPITH